MSPGKIILINGASSSGKTALARAVQNKIDEPFWHLSFDHLREDGISPILPMKRILSGDFEWKMMRAAVFNGFHNALPAIAAAGNNLIVEHIVETPEWMACLLSLLSSFDIYFVGIHCPLAELERRELGRKNRNVGEARRDFETIHKFTTYDLELDSMKPPEINADSLIASWKRRSRPSAFEKMATTL
jgi:chloramphenicol 3-O phosphotransferase